MRDLRTRLEDALTVEGIASSDFDLNPGIELPADRKLKPAAVLVCVRSSSQSVILTTRSNKLKHHPGQVAFPGGKMDEADATIHETALREAEEEIGLPRERVSVLGQLPPHETVTGYSVTPILAYLDTDFKVRIEPGEVANVFDVPLEHIQNKANFRTEGQKWQGLKRHYYVLPYGPHYIWGATARMLRALSDRIDA